MTEESTHLVTINGVVHVVFNEIVASSNKDKLMMKFQRCDALPTICKEICKNIFGIRYIVITVLVPEHRVLDYTRSS